MIHATIAHTMHPLTVAHSGAEIYVNLIGTPAAIHIGQQPHILALATRLLRGVHLTSAAATIEHDFGRPIGNTDIVETTAKDIIFYAKKLKQDMYTRFVKRRNLATSQHLSLSLVRDPEGNYELTDVRVGQHVPPMPGTKGETHASKAYWLTHATILENQSIQHQTITRDAPY